MKKSSAPDHTGWHWLSWLSGKRIFLIAATALVLLNLTLTLRDLSATFEKRWDKTFDFSGNSFRAAAVITAKEKYVGYVTNRNLEDSRALARFVQGQLIMAPVILNDKNLDYRYVIVDCDTLPQAMTALQKLNTKPVHIDKDGVILAIRGGLQP